MIREKGEALSPVKINRNVWSNSASQVKGLFTVCEHLLLTVKVYGLRERETGGGGEGQGGPGGRKEEKTEGERRRIEKQPRGREGKCKYEEEKGGPGQGSKGRKNKGAPRQGP